MSQPSPDSTNSTVADGDAGAAPDASDDPLDSYLPDAGVDSRWWYWIAAVPVYALLSMLFGFALVFVFFLAGIGDFAGLGLVAFALFFLFVGLPGLVLIVLFPIATYVDAKAVAEADLDWDPDPVLFGLLALASVLVSAFTASVILALYYLYRRHQHVGTP